MDLTGQLPRGSRRGFWLKVVFALYIVAAALLPFGHHDLACHLKSTSHCTTCHLGTSTEHNPHPVVLAALWLNDAGAAAADPVALPYSASIRPSSGRAPPVSA